MCEIGTDGSEFPTEPSAASGRPAPRDEIRQLCATLAEVGAKLDRLEDAIHDLTQVLARAVGPPWDAG